MQLNLFKNIYSHYLFKKSEFTHLLALVADEKIIQSRAWIYFKLGMYATVRSLYLNQNSSCEDLLAHAASNAACADSNKLQQTILIFEKKYSSKIILLIETLAPFDIQTAYLLAQKYQIQSLHIVALMILHQQHKGAQQLLNQLINSQDQVSTNSYLLQAQIYFHTEPTRVLESINHALQLHQLLPLKLVNPTESLSVTNILTKTQAVPTKKSKLISILMTAYNCEKYISTTLESLLEQTHQNIEIIIIDDCSQDNTWQILQEYQKKDQRIHIYQQPQNLGTYVAKNRALLLAKGEFIICHDSDDWSHPQRLEYQLRPLLQNKKLVATTSEWFRLSNEGEVYARSVFPISRLNPSSPLFRRKLILQKLGFWDNVRTGADSEFLARLKLYFGRNSVKKIAIPLAIGAHHAQSLMNAPETGFTSKSIPQPRLDYWESWSRWHIQSVNNKKLLYMPLNPLSRQRKFDAPHSILLEDATLIKYQNHFLK